MSEKAESLDGHNVEAVSSCHAYDNKEMASNTDLLSTGCFIFNNKNIGISLFSLNHAKGVCRPLRGSY